MARKQSLAAALVLLCALGIVSCKKPAASSEGVPVLAKKWEFTVGGKITGALALAGDGTLYTSCEDGFIYALDPAGTLQWKTYVGPTEATPAIGSDGAIYVSNSNGQFFALNHSGSIRWTIDSYDRNTVNKSAGALGRDYLYGVSRGSLLAVRLDNGQIAWQSTWGGDQMGLGHFAPGWQPALAGPCKAHGAGLQWASQLAISCGFRRCLAQQLLHFLRNRHR